jgi:hypothetical protein
MHRRWRDVPAGERVGPMFPAGGEEVTMDAVEADDRA